MTGSDLTKRLEDIDAMFVQLALAVEHVDGRIVLHEVSPATLYFSDRPQRVVGHINTGDFVGLWDEGDDSFASDPPNAVLSFIGRSSGVLRDVVLEIDEPIMLNGDLSYQAGVLEGTLPSAAGECTLFIDPFGRPLSPMSVAGMRRRTRRRTRRRVAAMAVIT